MLRERACCRSRRSRSTAARGTSACASWRTGGGAECTASDLSGPLDDDLAADLLKDVGLAGSDLAGPVWIAGTGLSFVHLPVVAGAVADAGPGGGLNVRPSRLLGRAETSGGRVTRCHVAGRVHHVASGEIVAPPVG